MVDAGHPADLVRCRSAELMAIEELQIGPWRIEFDSEATRKAYETVHASGPAECACAGCKNWLRARDRVYPKSFIELLSRLGIDPTKESEIVSYYDGPPHPGPYPSSGWFHFFGTASKVDTTIPETIQVSDSFRYSFHTDYGPGPEIFTSGEACRLEWISESTPWLLSGDEYRIITTINDRLNRRREADRRER
jgi:hypothetical protein